MELTKTALDRIIAETGPGYLPVDLDREQLRSQLESIADHLFIRNLVQKGKAPHARLAAARQIDAACATLLRLLEPGSDALSRVYFAFPLHDPPEEALLVGLRDRLKRTRALLNGETVRLGPRPRPKKSPSPKTLYVASLRSVFERHLHRKAGASRTSGALDGPFIRFARAVARECGVKIKVETVAKNLCLTRRLGIKP